MKCLVKEGVLLFIGYHHTVTGTFYCWYGSTAAVCYRLLDYFVALVKQARIETMGGGGASG